MKWTQNMMMRRVVILVMLAILLTAAGCAPQTDFPVEKDFFYDESIGRVFTEISDNFDFKIAKWELQSKGEAGEDVLYFTLVIKNKPQTRINNFHCVIMFDGSAADLFQNGKTRYEQNQPVDLASEENKSCAIYSYEMRVNSEEVIEKAGFDKNELLERVRNITFKLIWNDGEETVAIDCGVIKKADAKNELLSAKDFIAIGLSAPQGSGSIRTMTLYYRKDGEEKTDNLDEISFISNSGYDEEAKEQTLTDSDENKDGIVDFVVYREFWFPDLTLSHPEVPGWPTVYEYDLNKGFVIASSKHAAVFTQYAKALRDQLNDEEAEMTDNAKLSCKRLIAAAERIADGSFVPEDSYMDMNYYDDVYELTKDIKE